MLASEQARLWSITTTTVQQPPARFPRGPSCITINIKPLKQNKMSGWMPAATRGRSGCTKLALPTRDSATKLQPGRGFMNPSPPKCGITCMPSSTLQPDRRLVRTPKYLRSSKPSRCLVPKQPSPPKTPIPPFLGALPWQPSIVQTDHTVQTSRPLGSHPVPHYLITRSAETRLSHGRHIAGEGPSPGRS